MGSAQIMVVEDERLVAMGLELDLKHMGYDVVDLVSSGEEALTLAGALRPDLVLMDIYLDGEMDGVRAADEIRTRYDIPVVYVTAYSDDETVERAKASEPYGYLVKPWQPEMMRATIEVAMHMHGVERTLKHTVDRYRRLAHDLRARNRELDAFGRTVAHELQNVVSRSIGYADLLAENHTGMTAGELEEHLRTMLHQGQQMNSIIRELLVLSGLCSATVVLQPLNMAEIVSEAQNRLADMSQQLQAQIRLPQAWPSAVGHAPWIEEVWYNYIGNALQFGGRPPLVELGAEEAAGDRVRFWVRDNGPGLRSEEADRLFEPFARPGGGRRQGYGLGLSVVRRVMDTLGGQAGVQVGGGYDGGCLFYFDLPCPTGQPKPSGHQPELSRHETPGALPM